jgi:hypothetical protein
MATIADAWGGERSDRWFYVSMAALFTAIAFGGFIPTYWGKLASGSFAGNPVIHVHGLLFFGWTLLYLTQTLLVATHRTPMHRSLGLIGIALVSGMAFTVVLASINEIKVAQAIGMGDAARRFVVVPLLALPLFTGFFCGSHHQCQTTRNTQTPDDPDDDPVDACRRRAGVHAVVCATGCGRPAAGDGRGAAGAGGFAATGHPYGA